MRSKKAKKIKVKRTNQMTADRPGGFQKPSEEDEKKVIEGKFKQRIEIQNQLIEANVGQSYAWAEAEELEKIHKSYDEPKEVEAFDKMLPNVKYIKNKPLWFGIPMPKKILVCEFNSKLQVYKRSMMKYNYLYNALKELGFTKEILKDLVVNQKIISDNKILKQLEDDYSKEKLKRDDVDAV